MIDAEILSELGLSKFIALDLETTGLDYRQDEIIEFGAVRFMDGAPRETLSLLLKPSKPIPLNISRITGITDDMVAQSPALSETRDQILSFLGDLPLVAHNVFFDLPFLEFHLTATTPVKKRAGSAEDFSLLSNDRFDSLALARIYLPFQTGFSLNKLAEYFHLPGEQSHRALPDARTAGHLFLELLAMSLRTDFKDVRKILEILEPTDDPLKVFFLRLQSLLAKGKYHFEPSLDKESLIYAANLYNIIGEEDTPENGHLKTEPIDSTEIAAFFNPDGLLEKSFGSFEHRESQVNMAEAVGEALNNSQFLVVEAGTGTGKSMAYLLPAIRWSIQNYGPLGRIVISTNTKNLQEQLFFKDLPILHSILQEKFKVVLLKGKANYLCLDKWYSVMGDMKYRLTPYERVRVLPLILWVKKTESGDISENNGFAPERHISLWSKFIAEDNYCPGRSCKYYSHCFLWRARNHARDAHLVLVNHSLLFSDLAAENSILNEYVNVIFDEAHNIEKVATEYLGMQITLWDFKDFIQKLYLKDKYETGILVQLRKRIQLSDLDNSKKELVLGHVDQFIPLTTTSWVVTQGFFKQLTSYLRSLIPEQNSNEFSSRHRYGPAEDLAEKLSAYYPEFKDYLKKMQRRTGDLLELLREFPEGNFHSQKQVIQELMAQVTKIDGLISSLDFLMAAEWSDWVYWFELPSRQDSDDSRLYAAPLKISEILHDKLYQRLKTAIFTSASLTVGKSFDYFRQRAGLALLPPQRLQTLLLDSPFHYDQQVMLAIPSFTPDPRSAEYRDFLAKFLQQLVKEQPRGTLVLFTSYSLLNDMYEALRLPLESEKMTLLAQGISGSRHTIISEFKQNPRSVLFGTDSFWEGVDVPGKALEILLITKLPFDVPTEPIIQARAEMIQREGGNPFMDYTIPEAVIKFRQGFGRLIRTASDFGVVMILDNRVIKKMYGRIFLESLPVKSTVFQDTDVLWEELLRWFQKAGKKV